MKFRIVVIFFLAFTAMLSGCAKKERIEGKVLDVFGSPLQDVQVTIQKSEFKANTDVSGNYSIDYAPGEITVVYSKDGYTTNTLDLNIQQKAYYPAQGIKLYPVPKEEGIYYIDVEKKRLVKLQGNGVVEENRQENGMFSLTMNYKYYIRYQKPEMSIKAGKAMFIDKIQDRINLTTVKEDGAIYEGALNMFERKDMYSGFIKDSTYKVGKENVLIREADLSSGEYAWVTMLVGDMIGAIPKNGGSAFMLHVEGNAK